MGRGRPPKYATPEEAREAARKRALDRYYNNKDSVLEKNKQYYQENRDRIRETQREYYQENKDELKEYYKAQYHSKKDDSTSSK